MEQYDFPATTAVTMQHMNNPLAPNRNDLEAPTVTHDREERMAADQDGNLGSRTPEDDVSRKCLQAEGPSRSLSQEQSKNHRALCFARILRTELTNDFITWPDTLKCKGTRQTERQSFAVTSEKYRETFEKKCIAKIAEENAKGSAERKT
jgi:hypothetical protein